MTLEKNYAAGASPSQPKPQGLRCHTFPDEPFLTTAVCRRELSSWLLAVEHQHQHQHLQQLQQHSTQHASAADAPELPAAASCTAVSAAPP